MTWRCRFFREGDELGMLRVLQASFANWPAVETDVAALDHLRWKMSSHPLAAQFTPVAERNGDIAGLRVFIVREVMFAGAPLIGYHAADISVHPIWQERGLLNQLVDIDYSGLGGRQAVQTFDLKLAYQSGHPAVLRLQETIPGIFPLGEQLTVFSRANTGPAAPPQHTEKFAIRVVDAFDDRLDAFWRQAATTFDLMCDRGNSVMNWRYADPRAGRFTIAIAEQDGALLGYVVTRCSRAKGYIADVLALPERPDVVGPLIDHGLVSLHALALERVECWLPERHPYQEVLRRAGFETRESQLRLNYRPCAKSAEELELLGSPNVRLHFTAGDTDLV